MRPYKKSLANYRSIACNLSAYSQSQKGGGVWNKWDADEFRLASQPQLAYSLAWYNHWQLSSLAWIDFSIDKETR
ncbi:hypothetical protein T05_9349 [Trichinella murrelli]|uniref:Uncharacterized protein n=1 Tax=Trichinella murrelli TaxID=144512 RepID=A0A0V0SWX6_9BILA|nr:hypothetical protein T05_9349 [Trichinella murrelli]